MEKQKGSLAISIIIILVVALISITGTYFFLKNQNNPQRNLVPINLPPDQPLPTPSDINNSWKTYTNIKNGYSLKYPNTWLLEENINLDSITIESIKGLANNSRSYTLSEAEMKTSTYLSVSMRNNENSLSLKKWFDTNETCGTTESGCAPESPKFSELKTINGMEVITAIWNLPGPFGYNIPVYYFSNGNKIFQLQFYFHDSSDRKTLEGINNQILSTFKFLEKSVSAKTYSNSEYNFQFSYPEDFKKVSGLGQGSFGQPLIEIEKVAFQNINNNVSGAFTVSVKLDGKSECDYIPKGYLDTKQYRLINGKRFTQFSGGGAALGTTYKTTYFHYLMSTTCYELVTTIMTSGVQNSPEGISKFEEQQNTLSTELDKILSTFKFTNQTQAQSATPTPTASANTKIYSDPANRFTFTYPPNMILDDSKSNMCGTNYNLPNKAVVLTGGVPIPKNGNLQMAYSFGISSDPSLNNPDTCYLNPQYESKLIKSISYNNQQYYFDSFGTAAAGCHQFSEIYRTLSNNQCFEISLNWNESSDWNNPADFQTAKDEQEKAFTSMRKILSTIKF